MIFVDRERLDEHGQPIHPDDEWFKKSKIATSKATTNPANHKINRAVYAANIVRAALEKLFYRKCAYCEQEVERFDVEHFRPKGRVAEREDHPGYYWLAYNWDNLLLSCADCNQRRKDRPKWGDLTYGTTGGKADQFPLRDESKRAMSHRGNLTSEEPLLINPCVENPEGQLKYLANGEIVGAGDSGDATIQICSLTRRRLQDRRKKIIDRVNSFIRLVMDLRQRGRQQDAVQLGKWLQESFLNDNCQFAGAARYVFNNIDEFPARGDQ